MAAFPMLGARAPFIYNQAGCHGGGIRSAAARLAPPLPSFSPHPPPPPALSDAGRQARPGAAADGAGRAWILGGERVAGGPAAARGRIPTPSSHSCAGASRRPPSGGGGQPAAPAPAPACRAAGRAGLRHASLASHGPVAGRPRPCARGGPGAGRRAVPADLGPTRRIPEADPARPAAGPAAGRPSGSGHWHLPHGHSADGPRRQAPASRPRALRPRPRAGAPRLPARTCNCREAAAARRNPCP